MNKELDELLCLLDGKITSYRIKSLYLGYDDTTHKELIEMQKKIQDMWHKNKEGK